MIVRFVSGLVLCLLPLWVVAADQRVAIALHGGAGTIERDRMCAEAEAEYRSFLDRAISEGYQQLQAGEEGLDVVVAIIQRMEDSSLFNAGKGSVYTWDGKHELDASIMHGAQLDAGAVAGVTTVQSPIALARAVMEQSPHVMLASKGAEQFARELGIPELSPAYFETERGKRWGRIGDAPVIGAGTYADNNSCAVSATGHGEFFIRHTVARDICARMQFAGQNLQEAAETVIMDELVAAGGDGGIVAVDATGEVSMVFNTPGMYRASVSGSGEKRIGIFGDEP